MNIIPHPEIRKDASYKDVIDKIGSQIVARSNSCPITLIGLKTGGDQLSESLEEYLKNEGLNVRRLAIRVDSERGQVEPLDRMIDRYLRDRHIIGVDDALWTGGHRDTFLDYMKRNRRNFGYLDILFAVIFDATGDADFSYMRVTR